MTLLLYGDWRTAEVDGSWFVAWLMLEAFKETGTVMDAELDVRAAEQAGVR